jgi:hypothetical protein
MASLEQSQAKRTGPNPLLRGDRYKDPITCPRSVCDRYHIVTRADIREADPTRACTLSGNAGHSECRAF